MSHIHLSHLKNAVCVLILCSVLVYLGLISRALMSLNQHVVQQDKLDSVIVLIRQQRHAAERYINHSLLALDAQASNDMSQLLLFKESADDSAHTFQELYLEIEKASHSLLGRDERLLLLLKSYKVVWDNLADRSAMALKESEASLEENSYFNKTILLSGDLGTSAAEMIDYISLIKQSLARDVQVVTRQSILAATFLMVMSVLAMYFKCYRPLFARSQGLAMDTTELHSKVKELEGSNIAKRSFLANMSHEIRTPMVGVMGYAQLLKETELSAKQKEFVLGISTSGAAMLQLIDDVLYFSKIESGKLELHPEPGSMREAVMGVQQIMKPMFEGKGLEFNIEIAEGFPDFVVLDHQRYRQVVINLVNNAFKYTQKGGVYLSLSYQEQTNDRVGQEVDQDVTQETESLAPIKSDGYGVVGHITLRLRDTGSGIELEEGHRLFSAFQQAKHSKVQEHGGVGLGLSIVNSILDAMDGVIDFESDPGIGTTVIVTVPTAPLTDEQQSLVQRHQTQTALFHTQKAASLQGQTLQVQKKVSHASQADPMGERDSEGRDRPLGKVLVVEDNVVNQKVLLQMLKKMGFETALATNGEIAVNMVDSECYLLVLMDYNMPVMDGVEATKQIRDREQMGRRARVPIIAVTANTMSNERQAFIAAGIDDYISKPFTLESLGQVMERWVA